MRRLLVALAVLTLTVACAPARARVLRNLDFQTPHLLKRDGHPTQWDNYVPDREGTSGVTLGSPGTLPFPYKRAARFVPSQPTGRPRSMAKLGRESVPDPGVKLKGPLDAAEGVDRYYRWWTLFPSDFDLPVQPVNAPTVFQAWHNNSSLEECNTNVQMHAKRRFPGKNGLRYLVRVQGGLYSKTPPSWFVPEGGTAPSCYSETFKEIDLGEVHPGRWTLWKIHIHWSSQPSSGLMEIERDGKLTRIAGANLYRSRDGLAEAGFMEHGFYSPVDRSEEARHRSVWQVGMRIGDAPKDMGPTPGCRSLRAKARHVRVGHRTIAVDIGEAADASHRAVVSMTGGRVAHSYVAAGKKRYRFRGGEARVPVRAFAGATRALTVHVGRSHSATLRVHAEPCL